MFRRVAVILGCLIAVGCGDSDSTPSTDLTLTFTNLQDLGADYVYEGWLITPTGPVTTGRFSVSNETTKTFQVDSAVASVATNFVLTIEPAVGDDPAPADTHIIAGPISNGTATLTAADSMALGTDFANAAGGYILETPSSTETTDYANGVWFLDPAAGPGASLTLPTLPAGWAYEGWVVSSSGPVSTGRFTDPAAADSDGGGSAAGPENTPPFPGQDFITPPSTLIGYTVVISVEPDPDNGPEPFIIKPLIDDNAEDVGAGTLQTLANQAAASIPSGTATLSL